MAAKLFPISIVTASPSLFFLMLQEAKSGRWFEKCIGDAEDDQDFLFSSSTMWWPMLSYAGGICCFLDFLTNLPSQVQNFACPSQSAFLPSLAIHVSIEFFPQLSVCWAVATLLLPLPWLSSPGSWVKWIVGPCWPICQEWITGCTAQGLIKDAIIWSCTCRSAS